ncbi:unnamed protein product [Lupinus luteus]|uniref:Uncharacterized protein n=1 Tax=Lupinus luteus TaxID=3873 RepID=A0AAV1YFZ8_LUPLU
MDLSPHEHHGDEDNDGGSHCEGTWDVKEIEFAYGGSTCGDVETASVPAKLKGYRVGILQCSGHWKIG